MTIKHMHIEITQENKLLNIKITEGENTKSYSLVKIVDVLTRNHEYMIVDAYIRIFSNNDDDFGEKITLQAYDCELDRFIQTIYEYHNCYCSGSILLREVD